MWLTYPAAAGISACLKVRRICVALRAINDQPDSWGEFDGRQPNRHTNVTLMLASGVPPKVAPERLGYTDPTLFTNLYSHVTATMQRDAADRLGRALFGYRMTSSR